MSTDARILTSLPNHPKTKKLIRRHGQSSAWNLICLFLFARENKPDGVLTGMTAEDIEIACDWQGGDGELIACLIDIGFIEQTDTFYAIHDWQEHNPWSYGAKKRTEVARLNAMKRWDKQCGTDANGTKQDASGMQVASNGNAPPPPPPPPPPPKSKPLEQQVARFTEFWNVYPNKKGRKSAETKWKARKLDALADKIIADVKNRIVNDKDWKDGYIPHGSTYVNGEGWQDGLPPITGHVVTSVPNYPSKVEKTPEQIAQEKREAQEAFNRSMAEFGMEQVA